MAAAIITPMLVDEVGDGLGALGETADVFVAVD